MERALVLGATGFIGGHVALAALEQGWEVRGLRRRTNATGHLENAQVRWIDGDIDCYESLPPAFHGVDIVFHAAGFYPNHGRNVAAQVAHAVRQTRNVLQAAVQADVQRLIYTSSLTTIGHLLTDETRLVDERDHYTPGSLSRSAYYECKYAMESEVLREAAYGFPTVVLNPTVVLGPGDLHRATGEIVLAIARGWGKFWLDVMMNVVDVRDAAQAHIRAAEVGRLGERYILGGHNVNMRELFSMLAEISGVRAPGFELPDGFLRLFLRTLGRLPVFGRLSNHLWGIRRWRGFDTDKAKRELNLDPRPIEDTLSDAVAWYRTSGYLAEK
ncbi:MAG: NAD-dependent epimerase/dehydratase family protein [Anaerolineales bacterium]|nr:NAD-dependent epimerase/dehydratase family protein [Anaerolineales bacterium]